MAGRALTTTRAGAVSAGQHSGELSRARFRRPELYINREISLVEFSQRVLDEAKSARHPLLERVKFLSFVGSQMDEFMMIRLAGLYDQVDAAVIATGPDGMLPRQQIDALHVRVRKLLADAHATWEQELRPDLLACGVEIAHYHELTKHQRDVLATFFRAEILPVLTPLGVDPGHPFPHISNRSLNLAVTLSDPGNEPGDLFARVKVPATLRRLIKVPVRPHKATDPTAPARYVFTWLEELMAAHLDLLFPGFRVVASHPFRVLRDADFEVQTDEAGDLLETVEQGVMQRRFGATVNLSVQPDMPTQVRRLLTENLELDPEDVWEHDAPLGLSDLAELADIDRPDLKDTVTMARVPVELKRGQDPFMAIRGGDLLLHHPYDAFSSVADFIEAAAQDPQVLAIKQTLYRVGRNSPIVQALLDANARGKQVAVLVELKARFDEENNIEWARTLEAAGVHVVYGQVNLKTHAKVALVVRRELDGVRLYTHLGTGNYNASTARSYEDYALLTSRPDICDDVMNLFNALTGFARVHYERLLVSPVSMRQGLLQRIDREIDAHKRGGQGRLIFKTNALVDPEIIRALYRASHAGVAVDLIIRGICCLRPGIPGVSEHIQVRSIVGRFLEHSRVYYFANGGAGAEVLLGSADLMERNLDHRIEVLFPLDDARLRDYLATTVLPAYLRDTVNTRILQADGRYEHVQVVKGEPAFDVQQWMASAEAAVPVRLQV